MKWSPKVCFISSSKYIPVERTKGNPVFASSAVPIFKHRALLSNVMWLLLCLGGNKCVLFMDEAGGQWVVRLCGGLRGPSSPPPHAFMWRCRSTCGKPSPSTLDPTQTSHLKCQLRETFSDAQDAWQPSFYQLITLANYVMLLNVNILNVLKSGNLGYCLT